MTAGTREGKGQGADASGDTGADAKASGAERRAARQAEALRANLKRRKEQARGRRAPGPADEVAESGPAGHDKPAQP